MKISKERLVEIIREEVEASSDNNVKALNDFSLRILQISKEIKSAKGLDSQEMSRILEIFIDLIEYAAAQNGASILKQLSGVIDKRIGTEE